MPRKVTKAMLKKVMEIGGERGVRRFRLCVYEKNNEKGTYILYEFTASE